MRSVSEIWLYLVGFNRFVTAPIAEEFNISHLIACEDVWLHFDSADTTSQLIDWNEK